MNERPDNLTPVSGSQLSDREMTVLQLIVDGASNKEIATEIKVTEATVKFHVGTIFDKLGVRTRTQAAVTALRRGFVNLYPDGFPHQRIKFPVAA